MRFKAIKFQQGEQILYVFCASAKTLWSFLEINKRTDDKDEGYQRALSTARAQEIKKYVEQGKVIAPAIIVALEEGKASFDDSSSEIVVRDGVPDAGWVIDGQHRLRGAELADVNAELAVVAFLGIEQVEQIRQFVTINREAKGVPTSLYYDLLKLLPGQKKPADQAKEISAAIAEVLRKDVESPFFDRIVVVTSPKKGEISLNNFVRKVYPMVVEKKGFLSLYSQKETAMIIDNYFKAMKRVFPEEFSLSKQRFFQTLGFGALMNALPVIFNTCLKELGGFRVEDVEKLLTRTSDFNFSDWDNLGTGSSAEIQAGKDFESYFQIKAQEAGGGTLLKLE